MPSSKYSLAEVVRRIAVLSLALIATAVVAQGHAVPPPFRLSDGVTPGLHFPVMVLDAKGHIDVAWSQPNGVFFRHSTDGGVTFFNTVEVQLVAAGQTAVNLQMGTDAAGDIDLLWAVLNSSNGSLANLFFSRSTDGGFTFSAPKGLVPNFAGTVDNALLVHPNGAIDIVTFAFMADGSTALFFARSTDGGTTFPAPVTAWTLPPSDFGPNRGFGITAAAGSNGQLYLFWSHQTSLDQCDLLATRSLDSGQTFSPAMTLSHPAGCSLNPIAFVEASGGVDLTWETRGFDGTTSVYFGRSSNEGSSFSTPVNVSAGFFPSNNSQQMAIDSDGEIAIAWNAANFSSGHPILFARSADHGQTFSTPKILSHSYVSQPSLPASDFGVTSPALSIDSHGNVGFAYGEVDVAAMFYRRSTDEGISFSNPLKLSPVAPQTVLQLLFDKNANVYILSLGQDLPSTIADVFFNRIPASTSLEGDFRIKSLPRSVIASQGETLHFTVTARSNNTHHHAVQLSCGDLPVNSPVSPTCTFTPPSLSATHAGVTADLTLTIPANEPLGAFLFEVQGEGGATIDTDTTEVTVK
jgi:hypothetical protein